MTTQFIPSWRVLMRQSFTSVPLLADFLELSAEQRPLLLARSNFPLLLPRRLAEKIEKGNLDDPILRQFVPLDAELRETPGFVLDPVQDLAFRKEKKLLKKYRGRTLLLATSACVMNCRFCFRRNFPYETEMKGFGPELELIRADGECEEVILSGGDPLSLGNEQLGELFAALEEMPQVRRIRFHTRFPIGIPERIDEPFLNLLKGSRKQLFFVIHVNHPLELDGEVLEALRQVRLCGVPVLSQSVLLAGVNDKEGTLLELCRTLIDGGVLPYYLHSLDPVAGTSHFAVGDERAKELIRSIQKNLSGYGVPRLVREEPGKLSKTAVF